MNVLVTGNLGYNGPILVQELMRNGHHVIGLDCGFFLDRSFMPVRSFLPQLQIIKDMRSLEKKDLQGLGVEAIVHLAALSNDPLGEISPEQTYQINTEATKKLFSIAQQMGVKHFIYASSCSTYGKMAPGTLASESMPLEPLTAYAKSKAMSENFLLSQSGKTKVCLMRFSTMFGSSPMLRLDLVVNNLVAHALLYNSVKIQSDGTPWRPLIHVRDFARMTSMVAQEGITGVYNAGFNSMNFQVKDIGNAVSELTGSPLDINSQKTPDERSYKVDFSKIEPIAGQKPSFGLQAGIKELRADYAKYKLQREDFESGKYARAKTLMQMVEAKILSPDLRFSQA